MEIDDLLLAAAASVLLIFCAVTVAFIATELLSGPRARTRGGCSRSYLQNMFDFYFQKFCYDIEADM